MRKVGYAFALSLIAGSAMAGPVTWVVSGVIGATAHAEVLPTTPVVGEAFTYTLTFDNETPDSDASPGSGRFSGAILSANFSSGGESYDVPIGVDSLVWTYNEVNNGEYYHQYSFRAQTTPNGTYPMLMADLHFQSTSPLAFGTDGLPTDVPDPGIFQTVFYFWGYENAAQAHGDGELPTAYGQVNSISQTQVQVPEPATALLFGTSLFAMGIARRRRPRA